MRQYLGNQAEVQRIIERKKETQLVGRPFVS